MHTSDGQGKFGWPGGAGGVHAVAVGATLLLVGCLETGDQVATRATEYEVSGEPQSLLLGDESDLDMGAVAKLEALAAPRQRVDRVYSARMRNGRVTDRAEEDIPASAHRFDGDLMAVPEQLAGPLAAGGEEERISPRLLDDLLAHEAGESVEEHVELAVTFHEVLRMPRFPDPEEGESRESPQNDAVIRQAKLMLDTIDEARRPGLDRRSAEVWARHQAVERERFTLAHGLVVDVPLSQVRGLAARQDIAYVDYNEGDAPPPHSADDIVGGRTMINSDPYTGWSNSTSWIGMIDTGVRTSHTLFTSPDRISITRDCLNGTSNSCATGSNLNPDDDCWNHGTGVASIMSANSNLGANTRGVTDFNFIDSWKVYAAACGQPTATATDRAFAAALTFGDRVIMVNTQHGSGDNDAWAQSADAAFDLGSVVLAAAGNNGSAAGSVTSPARAHKVLAIGAVSVPGGVLATSSGRGPATDGRIKPDLVAPNAAHRASTASDTALRNPAPTGTSSATPFATGAAALARRYLNIEHAVPALDAGQVNSFMILSGQTTTPDNNRGAGLVFLPTNGFVWVSKTALAGTQTTFEYTFNVQGTISRVDAAIWWPEAPGGTHQNLELRLIRPNGTTGATGTNASSVFQRARATSSLATGNWKLRITRVSGTAAQTVYFSIFKRD